MPKGEAVISRIKGTVHISQSLESEQRVVRVDHSEMTSDTYEIPEDWNVQVRMKAKSRLVMFWQWKKANIIAQHAGRVRIEDNKVIVSYENRETEEYDIPPTSRLTVKEGRSSKAASL